MLIRSLSIAIVISLWVCLPRDVYADVYKFVGQDGMVFYSQNHKPYRSSIVRSASTTIDKLGYSHTSKFSEAYDDLIQRAASRHGLDPALLRAVIQAESSYDPFAVSYKGAIGLMQLMPNTAMRFGVWDPYDPEQNILGGARYLRELLGLFNSDVQLAVAAYNAGENNVIKYGMKIPPFQETQNYVNKVMSIYRP